MEKCPCGGSPLHTDPETADNVRTFRDETFVFCFKRCADEFDKNPQQLMLNLERHQEAARLIA